MTWPRRPHLSRRSFLAGAASGLVAASVPRDSRAAGDERFLLIVFAQGGWDVNYALDPKRAPACDVPPGEITRFAGGLTIRTAAERPSIRAFFDAHAGRSAVVNGIWVGSVAHAAARARMLTGTRTRRSPDVAAIFAATEAERRPGLALPYVDLGGGAFAGPLASHMGRVGATNQLVTLLGGGAEQRGRKDRRQGALDDDERAALRAFTSRRAAAAAADPGAAMLPGFQASQERAEALRRDPELRALKTGRTTSLAQQGQLAVSLFTAGTATAAFLDTRLDWDTHDDIDDQGRSHEQLFAELLEIARRLDEADLLDRTCVAVLSEFSRTPKLNGQGGKDHWPVASALLFGGGVRPGRYGATDERLGALPVRLDDGTPSDSAPLLKYDNFAAGILEHLGVSSRRWFNSVEPFHGPFA